MDPPGWRVAVLTRLIEEGNFFERGGCNFSHVMGEGLPLPLTAAGPTRRPQLRGDGRLAGAPPAQPVLPTGT